MPEEFVDGDVIYLNDDNFDEIVHESNEIWILNFQAEWCYHCNRFLPEWVAAAKALGAKVRFGLIDADESRKLARRLKVYTLPVLMYFKAGYGKTDESAILYDG